jgi:hypothetical protein
MTETTAQSLMKSVPDEVLDIFGDAPILSTEDAGRYHAMIAAFAEHVDPGDFITWCYIKDLADCRTEIWRYRRMKAQTVDNAHRAVVAKQLAESRAALAQAPAEIRARLVKQANEKLKQQSLQGDEYTKFVADMEMRIEAETKARQDGLREKIDHWQAYVPGESELAGQLHVWIGQHQTLDQQISAAEERSAAAEADLERHLFGFGRALRGKLHQIIEGEVVDRGRGEIPADRASPRSVTEIRSTSGARGERSTAGAEDRRLVSGTDA